MEIYYGLYRKSILSVLSVCISLLFAFYCFSLAARASEVVDSEEPSTTTEAMVSEALDNEEVTEFDILVSDSSSSSDPVTNDSYRSTVVSGDNEVWRLTDFQTSVTSIQAANSTGFKSVVLGLFGDYELITKEYTYTSSNGYTNKQVTTESDYPWMISAGIFTVVLYCLFRLLGGVLCGRK